MFLTLTLTIIKIACCLLQYPLSQNILKLPSSTCSALERVEDRSKLLKANIYIVELQLTNSISLSRSVRNCKQKDFKYSHTVKGSVNGISHSKELSEYSLISLTRVAVWRCVSCCTSSITSAWESIAWFTFTCTTLSFAVRTECPRVTGCNVKQRCFYFVKEPVYICFCWQ